MLPRLRAAAEVLLCSSIPTQVLLVGILALAGIRPPRDGTLSMAYVVAVSLGDTVLLVALMTWLTRLRGDRPSRLWLGARPVTGEVLHGLALTPLIFGLVIVVLLSLRLQMLARRDVGPHDVQHTLRTDLDHGDQHLRIKW